MTKSAGVKRPAVFSPEKDRDERRSRERERESEHRGKRDGREKGANEKWGDEKKEWTI